MKGINIYERSGFDSLTTKCNSFFERLEGDGRSNSLQTDNYTAKNNKKQFYVNTVKPLIDRHLYLNAPSNRPPPSQDDWKLDRHGGQLEVLR